MRGEIRSNDVSAQGQLLRLRIRDPSHEIGRKRDRHQLPSIRPISVSGPWVWVRVIIHQLVNFHRRYDFNYCKFCLKLVMQQVLQPESVPSWAHNCGRLVRLIEAIRATQPVQRDHKQAYLKGRTYILARLYGTGLITHVRDTNRKNLRFLLTSRVREHTVRHRNMTQ